MSGGGSLGRLDRHVGFTLGRLPDAAQVRASVRIEDVIAHCFGVMIFATTVAHQLRCRCWRPSHAPDRHPSSRIDREKQAFYCDVCASGGDVFTVIQEWLQCSFWPAVQWLAQHAWTIRRRPVFALCRDDRSRQDPRRAFAGGKWATYPYYAEDWTLLYQKLRTPDKRFFYRRPLPAGGWTWGLGKVRRVLYRLPMLAGLPFVLVDEGEKDADAAWEHDLPATTNPEGAGHGKWKANYSLQLRAIGIERVYVIPDNDDVGRLHADEIVASCRAANLRAWLLSLPDLPEHGDLSDFFARGGRRREVLRLMKAVRA